MKIYYSFFEYEKNKLKEEEKKARNYLFDYVLRLNSINPEIAEIVLNEYQKPSLVGEKLKFNLSHSKGLVMMAVSDKEIGIDCEKLREYPMGAAERALTQKELELLKEDNNSSKKFFEIWTYKEAFTKIVGQGLSYSLIKVDYINKKNELNGEKIFTHSFMLKDYIVTVISYEDTEPELIEVIQND